MVGGLWSVEGLLVAAESRLYAKHGPRVSPALRVRPGIRRYSGKQKVNRVPGQAAIVAARAGAHAASLIHG